ncbi:hypothetical protein CLV65_0642 [Pseudoscardovia suis]|uniref:Uncharacterized protein n=1 Tax=Pseudoscardovia suis TaxID=987063 RepID=A0A261EWY1_9BIFI|nr:hypothetical protein PSSU_1003 [Pseudoscardovia suis]PJJ68737.1 hypothetical protein CLV65_0642 [Pseudoscardovia suis]
MSRSMGISMKNAVAVMMKDHRSMRMCMRGSRMMAA